MLAFNAPLASSLLVPAHPASQSGIGVCFSLREQMSLNPSLAGFNSMPTVMLCNGLKQSEFMFDFNLKGNFMGEEQRLGCNPRDLCALRYITSHHKWSGKVACFYKQKLSGPFMEKKSGYLTNGSLCHERLIQSQ